MKRIMIFGIGKAYENFRKRLTINDDVAKIVALIDNDANKQGSLVNGLAVSAPEKAIALEYDFILVLGKFGKEISEQLRQMGVNEERIILESEIRKYKQWFKATNLQIFCTEKTLVNMGEIKRRRPIALFGSLIYAGGPLALLRMAQILKQNQYDVVIVVGEDGPALKEYMKSNLPVVMDTNALRGVFFEDSWLSYCSSIVLNGLQAAPIINNLPATVPVIWWLHDPEEYYRAMSFSFKSLSLKNVDVYAVSELAWQPLKKRFPDLPKQLLLYGIPKTKVNHIAPNFEGKLIFAVLGKVHPIKGQDIFLEAVSFMNKEKRQQCEFWVVGNRETEFATDLEKKATKYENFKILGEFDRAGMNELFSKISVVVTPSRADMMPTANVEAMMYGIPCIISENAGTAQFITDEKNGLITKGNDPHDLAVKMEWIVDNRQKLSQIGENSKSIYESYFTMDVFEKNVLQIIEKNIK